VRTSARLAGWLAALVAAHLSAVATASPAAAQRLPVASAVPLAAADSGDAWRQRGWVPPLASLIVPGAGQFLLGESRGLAYLAIETYGILEYHAQITEARRGRDRYRSLADEVARRFFGATTPVRSFSYYEAMRTYTESGAFDRTPGGDVDPEVDERTYNGRIWKLARDTYWADPDIPPPRESAAYAQAVSLYLQRAVPGELRWSWRDAALEHDQYRRAIKRSNDAFRRARTQLGLMLANHMLSMVDALATVRVRYPLSVAGVQGGGTAAVEVSLPWPRSGWRSVV
jgi:hypothetical protein